MNEHTTEHNAEHHGGTHHPETPHAAPHHEVSHPPAPKAGLNVWMVATLVLAGVIIGYGVANFTGLSTVPPPEKIAQEDNPENKAAPVAAILTDDQTNALPEDDFIFGDASAPVTIVEFSDFQCPFCEGFFTDSLAPMTKDFIDTGKAKLIYRDYPLSIHAQAVGAAHAAECADDQKKFKEMHDVLFAKQSEWSGSEKALDIFSGYAKKMGLDMKVYGECMTEQKNLPEIRKDMLDGIAIGVKGTPHFFINGHRISGALDYETVFKPAIQAELDNKEWKLSADPLTGKPFIEIQ